MARHAFRDHDHEAEFPFPHLHSCAYTHTHTHCLLTSCHHYCCYYLQCHGQFQRWLSLELSVFMALRNFLPGESLTGVSSNYYLIFHTPMSPRSCFIGIYECLWQLFCHVAVWFWEVTLLSRPWFPQCWKEFALWSWRNLWLLYSVLLWSPTSSMG